MTTEHTTHNPLDRRDFIKRASAAAVATLGAPYVWGQKTDDTLIVNSFGGEYQELFEKNIIEPFEKKFSVKVVHDATGTSSQDYAKIRASKGAPGFDVAAARCTFRAARPGDRRWCADRRATHRRPSPEVGTAG